MQTLRRRSEITVAQAKRVDGALNQVLWNGRRRVKIGEMQQAHPFGMSIGEELALHLMKLQRFQFHEAGIPRNGR